MTPEMAATASATAEHTQSLASLRLAVIESARAWDKAAFEHAEWYERTIKEQVHVKEFRVWEAKNGQMLEATIGAQDEFRRLSGELRTMEGQA